MMSFLRRSRYTLEMFFAVRQYDRIHLNIASGRIDSWKRQRVDKQAANHFK